MNNRSKLTAALLALFLGSLGAHWFYLGDNKAGGVYLSIFLGSIVLTLAVVGLAGFLILGAMCLGDFFTMLSMDPTVFDMKYNSAPGPQRRV